MRREGWRVLLAGVAGFNRGDDAIAHALLAALRQRFAIHRVAATVLKPGVFEAGVHEVVIDRKQPLSHARLAHAIWSSDLIVLGGGSIIQDEFHSSWLRGIMAFYVEVVMLAQSLGRPLVSAPIGVDRLHSARGRRMARRILSACQLLAVRDRGSAGQARELLGANAPIVLAADPAFVLEPTGPLPSARPACGLVVAPAFEAATSASLPALLAALIADYLTSRPDSDCCVLAMDERPEEDGGRAAAILDQLPPVLRARTTLCVPKTAFEALALLRSADALLTMRLHPLILAAGVTPTFCLSRGVKTDALAGELQVPWISLQRADEGTVIEDWRAFLRSCGDPEVRGHLLYTARRARAEQAERLDAYFAALTACLARLSPERRRA